MEGRSPDVAIRCVAALVVTALGVLGAGCRSATPVVTVPPPSVTLTPDGQTAFVGAAISFRQALGEKADLVGFSSFTEPQKEAAIAAAREPLSLISEELTAKKQLVPADSSAPEFRLLSRVLRWQIDRAATVGQLDEAVRLGVLGIEFGFSLIRGTPRMHSLGYQIAAESRAGVAPLLPQLNPGQLRKLSNAGKAALAVEWSEESLLAEMERNTRQAEELVLRNDEAGLKQLLGPDAKDFLSALRGIGGGAKQAALFGRLREQARWEIWRLRTALDMPAQARGPFWNPKERTPEQRKLWPPSPVEGKFYRFARHLTGFAKSLADLRDEAVARTRLLVLDAEIQRRKRLGIGLPADLDGFTPPLNLDPYSGQPFVLNSDGTDYQLFSVGTDFVDNGGETNETFAAPDLTVERKRDGG